MSKRTRVRLLLVGEFAVRGPNLLESARAQLDAFREGAQPAAEYGLTLSQATADDLAHFATPGCPDARGIDPAQAGFWDLIGRRPITREDTEPYGVEFLTDRQRLEDVRRRYPVPTVIDIGNGIFGAKVGLVYVDDDTGRAIAYAPPEIHRRPPLTSRLNTPHTEHAGRRLPTPSAPVAADGEPVSQAPITLLWSGLLLLPATFSTLP